MRFTLEMKIWVVALTLGWNSWAMASGTIRTQGFDPFLDQCDELYEERAQLELATDSAHCYLQYLEIAESDSPLRKTIHENIFQLLSWIATRTDSPSLRRKSISLGMSHANRVTNEHPTSGMGPYWSAVFLTLECQMKDEDRVVPSCMISRVENVIRLLKHTLKHDPSVHGFGADRFYGILMREIPEIAGGDRKLALHHLKTAYEYAPNFSGNTLEYARILMKLHRRSEARFHLETLVDANCMTMNPLLTVECSEDQKSARRLLRGL